jgi:hypothetical protein
MFFLKKILAKTEALSHARRSKLTILLDENIETLKDALIALGYRVLSLKKGLLDPEIQQLAQGSAILTKNTKDFINDAVRFDYDIIGIEDIRFVDDAKDHKNKTAKKISDAIRGSQFYNVRGNFLLKVHDNGKYTVTTLK